MKAGRSGSMWNKNVVFRDIGMAVICHCEQKCAKMTVNSGIVLGTSAGTILHHTCVSASQFECGACR